MAARAERNKANGQSGMGCPSFGGQRMALADEENSAVPPCHIPNGAAHSHGTEHFVSLYGASGPNTRIPKTRLAMVFRHGPCSGAPATPRSLVALALRRTLLA